LYYYKYQYPGKFTGGRDYGRTVGYQVPVPVPVIEGADQEMIIGERVEGQGRGERWEKGA
jgi:hypothetical protein